MVTNIGNATAYVAAGGHRPLPRADQAGYRAAHTPRPKKPTGLDWDALTPRCKACGEKSRQLDNTDTCPTCRGDAPAPAKPVRVHGPYQQLPDDEIERRFTAPASAPDGTRLGADLTDLEATDPDVAAAAAALDDTTDRITRPDDHVQAPNDSQKAGNQGRPTTRSSAPRATSPSSVPGSVPGAGSAAHREEDPAVAQETRPAATAGPTYTDQANLDAQLEHVARVLRATATSTDPVVRLLRLNALSAVESLHLYLALHPQTPAPAASPRPAGAGPDSAEHASPVVLGGDRPAADPEGEAGRRPATPRRRAPRTDATPRRRAPRTDAAPVDEHAVIREYQRGDSRPVIARRHGVRPKRITTILERHGVPLRDDRTKSGGKNRITLTDDLTATLRKLYIDDELTVAQVAEHLGHSRTTTTRLLREAGIEIRPAAHESSTTLTAAQEKSIVDRYVAGAALHNLAREHHIRAETARDLITAAGHAIRPKGASHRNAEAMNALGVTAADVRSWAVDQGLARPGASGLVPMHLIEAYAAAHPTTATPDQVGDTAA